MTRCGSVGQRCWRYDWVIDLDLRVVLRLARPLARSAARSLTTPDLRWILLYVERWLKAPLQLEDGTLAARDRGSPQGSAISPLLANIFLHYALDVWLAREFPAVPFERYADDVILHCKTKRQAQVVRDAITERLAQVGLELNLDKTRIVYCKDANRTRLARARAVRLPRLHVSSPARAEQALASCSSASPRRSSDDAAKAMRSHDQTLAAAPVERTDPRRPRTRRSTRSCEAGSTTTAASTGPS